ncbi:MAG: phosphate ABC transporter permease PstA [Polycyclovorans sp.]|jgi:phosphate transport system permease protein|nr:phosphate ABC transporter, permease protein PstA [Polycyclovorans sp.]MBU0789655.1 phosphate ABC transporter permease PstA [Gammaproteobacteria bacterium]MDP1542203.1 phosphate ABC transporter permease PstA [Polycyclovorans sp.]MEC8848272.1 phosphate ABC transporter permease PstA [Pseudomonadota bacterium]|tara:strand:- start:17607 stop:18956 length:1350 start_codon:yes stop_codon:yes gene_type:complete
MTTPNSKNAERLARVAASLKKRHAAEKRFRFFGVLASLLALSFVAIFFVSILSRGLPAFWQATFNLDVYFDPAIIEVEPRPVPNPGESPADFQQRDYAWQSQVGMVNWNRILENSLIALRPDLEDERRTLRSLFTSGERFALRDRFIENPDLLGQTVRLKLLADANVDVWIRGNIDRDLPDAQQQLSPRVRELADAFFATDALQMNFSTALLVNPDSRSSPASAGLGGAFMGSVYMILVVLFLSVPLAVAAAIYLEEFAPRNAITDLIEVNINNLAAVPSIVFGLLGAAVFINYLKMPLSAPLVGGLVLSLMTLPTVIIATRAALKAVPPSIRQAALGLGASKVQTVFHHVLPLAIPGVLTGAIIGVAQALGETAPLLLIGMSAFVSTIPGGPLEQSAALPVQIYLWQGNELRNFFEGRTAAAIIVLLALMLSMNALAIWLRKRFETRW